MGSGVATEADPMEIFFVYSSSLWLTSAVERSTVFAASVVSDSLRINVFFASSVCAEDVQDTPSVVFDASSVAAAEIIPLSSSILIVFWQLLSVFHCIRSSLCDI